MAPADAQAAVVLGDPQPVLDSACRFDQVQDPVTIVIFGATGDLTGRMNRAISISVASS